MVELVHAYLWLVAVVVSRVHQLELNQWKVRSILTSSIGLAATNKKLDMYKIETMYLLPINCDKKKNLFNLIF